MRLQREFSPLSKLDMYPFNADRESLRTPMVSLMRSRICCRSKPVASKIARARSLLVGSLGTVGFGVAFFAGAFLVGTTFDGAFFAAAFLDSPCKDFKGGALGEIGFLVRVFMYTIIGRNCITVQTAFAKVRNAY